MPEQHYNKEFRVYKPRSGNQGAALKLQFRIKPKQGGIHPEAMLFLEIAKQIDEVDGNSQFDWASSVDYKGDSVTMKLGVPDVGELLLVLSGDKEYVGPKPKGASKIVPGLFHKNQSGNTILKFAKQKGDYDGYAAQLSTHKDHSFRITLTEGEGIVLRVLLEDFIIKHYDWK